MSGYHLDIEGFTDAWIITPWQENGHLETYLQKTAPDAGRRIELVSRPNSASGSICSPWLAEGNGYRCRSGTSSYPITLRLPWRYQARMLLSYRLK